MFEFFYSVNNFKIVLTAYKIGLTYRGIWRYDRKNIILRMLKSGFVNVKSNEISFINTQFAFIFTQIRHIFDSEFRRCVRWHGVFSVFSGEEFYYHGQVVLKSRAAKKDLLCLHVILAV